MAVNPHDECLDGVRYARRSVARRRAFSRIILWVVVGGMVYLGAALVVFDFAATAFPYSEEYHAGREVALGPRPRVLFCRPAYHGFFYHGREWPFVVFQPICRAWLWLHGFSASAEWRTPSG